MNDIDSTTRAQLQLVQFCNLYAFGVPVPQALRQAGYEVTSIAFGYSLLIKEEAQKVIDETRNFIKTKCAVQIEHVIQELERDRDFAYQMENPSAAVAATMNKAKLLGFIDKGQNTPRKITIEWSDDESGQ